MVNINCAVLMAQGSSPDPYATPPAKRAGSPGLASPAPKRSGGRGSVAAASRSAASALPRDFDESAFVPPPPLGLGDEAAAEGAAPGEPVAEDTLQLGRGGGDQPAEGEDEEEPMVT